MFDIGSSELLLIIIVAVVVIGPKDLPRALYKLGQLVGKGRAMARHVRTGFDAMVREAEIDEMQKKWAKENERIMAAHPPGEEGLTPLAIADTASMDVSPEAPTPKRARKPGKTATDDSGAAADPAA
jgi:sec-independent protein translocase protein TatB